jgi:Tol biopolymer transport system component/DNA-binding winged helix-turn-helix (wHTH) protein
VHTPLGSLFRFGPFQVNSDSGELLKNGNRVKLQEQPFRLLVILLENAGEVVTRDDLRHRIWRDDMFVDFDGSLRVAVGKLREALGDDAENPRYIETIPKRGYRFLAPEIFTESAHGIGELGASPSSAETAAPDEGRIGAPLVHRSNWSRRWMLASVLLLLAVAGIAIAFRTFRQQRPQEQGALAVIPFTAFPGVATSPAFSPDGSRIAFAWNGDPKGGAKGFDLYVKALGSETRLRLTQHPSESISPTWSPDGTQIAFQRLAGADSGIFVVPALGGPERKLRPTRMPTINFNFFSWHNFTLISWSPDGKSIAFVDGAPGEELPSHARIYLLSTETMETKQVPISPQCVGEGLPAFSHNGEYLAYWCFLISENGAAVLYSLPIRGGQPKTISPSRAFPRGLTWSADDKRLIYSLNSGRSGLSNELGEVTVANGSTKQLAFAGGAELPTVSPKGDKLAYSSLSTSVGIWRRDLLHLESPAEELIPSSRAQFDLQYSPDGKRIAFASHRAGIQGVWISSDDGSDLVQISNPNYASGSPQWSPDGSRIAFDSLPHDRWEIYVADVAEGKPRKLVTSITNVVRPHWSRDGKWIYFRSSEVGRMGVYRCPASGGDAVLLTKDIDAVNPREALDGKTVYFASDHDKSTLRKVSLLALPGTASEVDGLPRVSHPALWALSTGGIYFVPAEAPRSIRYFDFATKQIRPIFEVDKDFGSGLSVSPDGRWIHYSLVDVNSDIMLVDHFH